MKALIVIILPLLAGCAHVAQPAVKEQISKSYGKEGETMLQEFLAAVDKASKN